MTPIEEIKSKIGILDIASQYVRLEKSGNQYKARCPFHNERTPSFYISPSRNTYHCFGCGASGDIFSFVENLEHIEFKEALKILAERAGVTLDYKKNKEDNTTLDVLRDASLFFEMNLNESLEAKKYLHDRGLLDETIKDYEIGFSKNDWRTLFVHLSTKGYSPEDIVDSGLVIKTDDNKYYDRFRGRVMFPIKNISGAIVGFTGRVLPIYDDGKSGKYVNTPETKVYHKSKILFNYDKAKRYIAESREVILAEGQMDVIMSHQAGIRNIIAVSGTAFTEDQVKMINRLADNVVLAFDNDDAGIKAAQRAAIMCAYGNMRVLSVSLDEKDIADIVLHNKDSWNKIIENKKSIIEFYAEEINKINDQSQKINFIKNQIIPYLRGIQSPIEKDFNITDFSRLTNINIESIKDELSRNNSFELEKRYNYSDQKEENIKTNKQDDLQMELFILIKELKIKEDEEFIEIGEEYIPKEIYNRKVMELENKNALNLEYYEKSVETYFKNLIIIYEKNLKNNSDIKDEEKLEKLNELNILKNNYNKNLKDKSIKMLIKQLVENLK